MPRLGEDSPKRPLRPDAAACFRVLDALEVHGTTIPQTPSPPPQNGSRSTSSPPLQSRRIHRELQSLQSDAAGAGS